MVVSMADDGWSDPLSFYERNCERSFYADADLTWTGTTPIFMTRPLHLSLPMRLRVFRVLGGDQPSAPSALSAQNPKEIVV